MLSTHPQCTQGWTYALMYLQTWQLEEVSSTLPITGHLLAQQQQTLTNISTTTMKIYLCIGLISYEVKLEVVLQQAIIILQ